MNIIAVFGSGALAPEDEAYQQAQQVGAELARAGLTVMSGGYGGIMEAASRGAAEAGGHVIGVTTAQFENEVRNIANPWVKEEIKLPKAHDRLLYLVAHADGYVIMPGGIGTLAELVTAWESIKVGDIAARPIVCYGAFWAAVLNPFLHSRYVLADAWSTTRFAETPDQVVPLLKGT